MEELKGLFMATGCISGSSRIGTISHVLALVPTAQLTPLFNDKELLLQHLYLQYLPENITPPLHVARV